MSEPDDLCIGPLDAILDADWSNGIPGELQRMDSTAFRKGYRHLRESVSVVRFGRIVGVYVPVPDAAMDEAPSYEADTGMRIRTPMVGTAGWTRLAWLIAELDDLDVWLRVGERAAKKYRRLASLGRTSEWRE
jgi:hypothetical protein